MVFNAEKLRPCCHVHPNLASGQIQCEQCGIEQYQAVAAEEIICILQAVFQRRIVTEFAGNVRVNRGAFALNGSCFGATFVGTSNEFSSRALAELNTIALPEIFPAGAP